MFASTSPFFFFAASLPFFFCFFFSRIVAPRFVILALFLQFRKVHILRSHERPRLFFLFISFKGRRSLCFLASLAADLLYVVRSSL